MYAIRGGISILTPSSEHQVGAYSLNGELECRNNLSSSPRTVLWLTNKNEQTNKKTKIILTYTPKEEKGGPQITLYMEPGSSFDNSN